MPRYYFDLQRQSDTFGVDLPDADAAYRYALRYASEVIRDIADTPRWEDGLRVDVRRDGEEALFSVTTEMTVAEH